MPGRLAATYVLAAGGGRQRVLFKLPGCLENVGSGAGQSNLEVIMTAERVAGRAIKYNIGPRRPASGET